MTDLSELLFPSDTRVVGHLSMIYNCFLDDSKDQKQEQMIISAGFFAPAKTWEALRSAWNKCLRDYGLEYFKTSEWKMLSGQFKKFSGTDYPIPRGRNAANKIRDDLHRILENATGINGIGVAVPVADYSEVREMPEAKAMGTFEGPLYHAALVAVISETLNVMRNHAGSNMAAFVHDDGDDFDELRAVYKGFIKTNRYWAKYAGGFQPLNDKKHPPLQAADMAANYALQLGQKWLSSGRAEQERQEFKKSIKWIGLWDKTHLLRLLRDQYKHRKLPIPSVLQNV
jgi:hypothetical protein